MARTKKILYLEDDPVLGKTTWADLKEVGYDVHWAKSIAQARQAVEASVFHLFLLDVNLPDGVALDFCREIRSSGITGPLLLLTGNIAEEAAVRGLALGANDYLRKPLGRRELLLRLKMWMGESKGRLALGNVEIDLDQKRAFVGQTEIKFTPSEFVVLALLASKPEQAISKDHLLSNLDEEGDSSDASLKSHLSRIRTKLKQAGADGVLISPVYGHGYRIETKK